MGTFFHPITITGPNGESESLDALVDTGSSFTTIPRPVLERLGVVPFARSRLRLATGQVVESDLGEVVADLNSEPPRTIICAFGEANATPLLGAQTLQNFLLAVDPDGHRLVRATS